VRTSFAAAKWRIGYQKEIAADKVSALVSDPELATAFVKKNEFNIVL
jgi:hypothetical protein